MQLKRTALLSALAAAAALGFAGPAHAATVSRGHWDVGLEYDCDTEEFSELHAHDHDAEQELDLATTTFAVSGTSNSVWEEQVFGLAEIPLKVIGDAGTYRVGFGVEPVGDCEAPAVTFSNVRVLAAPGGERVAGYRRTETDGTVTTRTRFDSTAGANRGLGLTVTDHEDIRWGFSSTGTFSLSIAASYAGGPIDTQPLTFSVS